MQDKKTLNFIKKAKAKHGDLYDYTLVEYAGSKNKVKIICPIEGHGVFEQGAEKHYGRGHGCPKCKGKRLSKHFKTGTEDFIKKAKEKHGNYYDYSLVEYGENDDDKVKIICPIHDIFEQAPKKHLGGQGCPDCGVIKRANTQRFTADEVMDKFIIKHGDKFDYPNFEYSGIDNEIEVRCKRHDHLFNTTPYLHLKNEYSCPRCAYEIIGEKGRLSQEEWVNKAKLIHGDLYQYDDVEYITGDKEVAIYCNACQKNFTIKATLHISKGNECGCPHCNMSKGEKIVKSWLDKNNIRFKPQFKARHLNCGLFQVGSGRYSYDFFIPSISLLIEIDGQQHFKPINFSGKMKDMEIVHKKSIDRDIVKNEIADLNNIDLLRIPYWEICNIEFILQETIYGDRASMLETYSYSANIDKFESGILPTDKDLQISYNNILRKNIR